MLNSFNSIKVRLRLIVAGRFRVESYSFNSIKVRLRLGGAIAAAGTLLVQFHNGTIKTGVSPSLPPARMSFNSIKVRLRPKGALSKGALSKFQFHKGTIKTSRPDIINKKNRQFQFHKGTIKTIGKQPAQEHTNVSIP